MTLKIICHALFLSLVCYTASAQNRLYVSTMGNDGRAGTQKRPFRTIARAQAEARKLSGSTVIYLREGVYRLDTTLVFTPDDGGAGRPLTIMSYPGEHAILSGGAALEKLHWKPQQNSIYASQTATPLGEMLIADGQVRPLARYPNFDSTAVRFNGTSADADSPARVKRWANPAGGYLHAMHASDWGDFHYRITGCTAEGKLKLEGGWQNNRQSGLHRANRMVENIFEELDAPGEWFYDRSSCTLFYHPLPNEDIEKVSFETSRLKHLVEFRGTQQRPVTHITLQNLSLTLTERTFMEKYEPLLRSDWTIYRGGAVLLEGTEHCTISNLDLYNLGGNGIFVSRYNRHATVTGSHFYEVGASAICLVGSSDAVRSPSFEYNEAVAPKELDRTPGPKSDNYPASCLIHDNLIHSIGRFEKQTTGVELSMCQNITVSHNSIYDTPRAGINVSEGTWGGHLIEGNDVFDTVKETGDHGSFNSWGRDRFWHPNRKIMDSLTAAEPSLILLDALQTTILRGNRFRCDRGWDIDLDDGSSNYHIYNNLCLNGGLKLREGFYRRVENNILVNNTFHPHVWFENSGDVFTRNVVMTAYHPIYINHWGCEIDYNLFTSQAALGNAQAKGIDNNSIFITPRFTAPLQGDYSLVDENGETFRQGFHNFDMASFGVLSPRLKALARTPKFPEPIAADNAEGKAATRYWQGLQVKSLTTLGERSATGMDTERGVYVVSVGALGCALRDYIRPNDVILNFAGRRVDKLNDLLDAAKKHDSSKPVRIVVFRMQKEQTLFLPAGTLQ